MKESRSAGVVIFRENQSHYEFLLLLYPAGHWDFVKGGFEKKMKVLIKLLLEKQKKKQGYLI